MNIITSDHVVLALQRALLGAVTPNIRAVTMTTRTDRVSVDVYYDGAPTTDDRESMAVVETELIAALPEHFDVDFNLNRLDAPLPVPKDQVWIYFRKEPQR